jgi:hypothetical protein
MDRVQEVKEYTELGLLYGNDQSRYDEYAKCAVASFKKWHPDIETIFINDNNLEEYFKLFGDIKLTNSAVVQKLILALAAAPFYSSSNFRKCSFFQRGWFGTTASTKSSPNIRQPTRIYKLNTFSQLPVCTPAGSLLGNIMP